MRFSSVLAVASLFCSFSFVQAAEVEEFQAKDIIESTVQAWNQIEAEPQQVIALEETVDAMSEEQAAQDLVYELVVAYNAIDSTADADIVVDLYEDTMTGPAQHSLALENCGNFVSATIKAWNTVSLR